MSCIFDFKQWLTGVRYSRNVCMLVPMEACMGHPIVVKQGIEYIIPFFKVASTENTDKLSPPFAYIRIKYPINTVLTYNSLYTMPRWRDIDWNKSAELTESGRSSSGIEDYYKKISCNESYELSVEQTDDLLIECLSKQTENNNLSLLVVWYKKLIEEAKKYR